MTVLAWCVSTLKHQGTFTDTELPVQLVQAGRSVSKTTRGKKVQLYFVALEHKPDKETVVISV